MTIGFKHIDKFLDSVFNCSLLAFVMFVCHTDPALDIPGCTIVYPL